MNLPPDGPKPRVGIVGLGIMGSAYARNLLKAGFPVSGTDVSPRARAALVEAGGEVVASADDLGAGCEFILLALPTADSLEAVAETLAGTARTGAILCEMGTLPLAAKESARTRLAKRGAILLDCPVSGTGAQAATGDLVIYASGERAACERARPVLEAFSRQTRYIGPFGAGTKLKFVANLLVTIHNLASAEAMVLAKRAGLDLALVREAVSAGAGQSRIFDLRAPLMVEGRFKPATAKLSVHIKDVRLILDFARELGAPAPLMEACLPLYLAALDEGHGDEDTAALFSVLADRTGG